MILSSIIRGFTWLLFYQTIKLASASGDQFNSKVNGNKEKHAVPQVAPSNQIETNMKNVSNLAQLAKIEKETLEEKLKFAEKELLTALTKGLEYENSLVKLNTVKTSLETSVQQYKQDIKALQSINTNLRKDFEIQVKTAQENLAQEIATSLKLENKIAIGNSELTDVKKEVAKFKTKYETQLEEYRQLEKVYSKALEQLNHPAFLDYVAAQGRDIGEKRPELKAAFLKAREVVGPPMNRVLGKGVEVLGETKDRVALHMQPLLGNERAQSISLLILVALMTIPIYVTYIFTQKIRKSVQLHQVVMFQNFYLAFFFLAVAIASISLPMEQDALHSIQSNRPVFYSLLQITVFFAFISHIGTTFKMVFISDDVTKKSILFFHLIATTLVGWHYYIFIWQNAMLDRPHFVSRITYYGYSATFGIGAFIASSVSNTLTFSVNRCKNSEKYI